MEVFAKFLEDKKYQKVVHFSRYIASASLSPRLIVSCSSLFKNLNYFKAGQNEASSKGACKHVVKTKQLQADSRRGSSLRRCVVELLSR